VTKLSLARHNALYAPAKLDLACGQLKRSDDFVGLDITAEGTLADIVCDLLETPWPIETNCVEELVCSHFVEHIPHWRPGWTRDGWWRFFDEVWRIVKPGGRVEIIHPYCQSSRAFWDPTHERYIHEATWFYLNAEWRRQQELSHYPTEVDFEVVAMDGMGISDELAARNAEHQQFARAHYWNSIPDLRVVLKSLKPGAEEVSQNGAS
jgi:predicted SAM-dependent methyltransferase